jgi:hypothetical protein
MAAPTAAPTVSPELRSLLRRLKLGRSLDTLPERLALARQNSLAHAEFLELVLERLPDASQRRRPAVRGIRSRAKRPLLGSHTALINSHWNSAR